MVAFNGPRDGQFRIVSASQTFIMEVLPWHASASRSALDTFVYTLRTSCVPVLDIDRVLLRCLDVLDRQLRLPCLTLQYRGRHNPWQECERERLIEDFRVCVSDAIKHHAVSDRRIRLAVALIEQHYADPTISCEDIARAVGLRPSSLAVGFAKETGMSLTEVVRNVRLNHAANQLATTVQSAKEIWTAVGYNDHSNFFHDFRKRFGCTPGAYRKTCGAVLPSSDRSAIRRPHDEVGVRVKGCRPHGRDDSPH
jgi:AraC-like DNA-binding protein